MRLGLLSLASLVAAGCGNLLGLGGLEFDADGDDADDRTPADVGGADDLGLGDGEPPSTLFLELGKSALVFRSESDAATFHVYFPETGTLESHSIEGGRDTKTVRHAERDWSTVLELPSADGTLLGYRDGEVTLFEGWQASGLNLDGKTEPASSGWTSIVAYQRGGQTELLSYDAVEGDYRWGPASEVRLGTWSTGFSELTACVGGAKPTLLRFAPGSQQLDRLGFAGDEGDLVVTSSEVWSAAFSHVACGTLENGELLLVRYAASSGAVEVGSLSTVDEGAGGAGGEASFEVAANAAWPEDYGSLTWVDYDGAPAVLGYDPTSGRAGLYRVSPLSSGSVTVK